MLCVCFLSICVCVCVSAREEDGKATIIRAEILNADLEYVTACV